MYAKTAVASVGAGGSVLAYTGVDSAAGIIAGVALLLLGAVLVRIAAMRRKRV